MAYASQLPQLMVNPCTTVLLKHLTNTARVIPQNLCRVFVT
jgi:hypothetical protein